jgi:glycosyltransferase involved in cell wall biosynthesis
MTPRRVLVIAYYFPPLGLSGVQRTLKFVKYLPQFGWHPTVLTVEDRGYFAKDEHMLAELEGLPVQVLRTHSLDPLHFMRKRNVVAMPSGWKYSAFLRINQFFLIPDNKIGWKKHALRVARQELRETQYQAIFATAPPYTDFLIAAELKKEFHIPVVLDYRDAWMSNPYHYYATPLHRFLHRTLETRALRYADHVVAINRTIKELIVRENNFPHPDVTILSQGYDPDDFAGPQQAAPGGTMRITYAGSFYDDRTPAHFLKAMHGFLEDHPAARGHIEACFLGSFRDQDRKTVEALRLSDVVRVLGYQSHHDTVGTLRQSDVLWLIIGDRPGAGMMSTGKLYEYIGAGKPILACVPDGEAKDILKQHGAAVIVPPEDVDAIRRALESLYTQHRSRSLPRPDPAFVARFDRRTLTGQLATILSRVTELGPADTLVATERAARATHPSTKEETA